MRKLERFSRRDACKGCGREILWGKTKQGRWVPVDPKLITIFDEHGEVQVGHVPHHSTCPNVEEFRK